MMLYSGTAYVKPILAKEWRSGIREHTGGKTSARSVIAAAYASYGRRRVKCKIRRQRHVCGAMAGRRVTQGSWAAAYVSTAGEAATVQCDTAVISELRQAEG
jgi:hypothetical protein